jgi:HEAT repeat protein
LNTERTKKRLAELVASDDENIRQNAVTALAEVDDPGYCGLMLEVMNARRGYSSSIAARGAGLLCGEKALPELIHGLQGTDAIPAYEVAYAFGNTGSRNAVPVLIDFLRRPDAETRGAAERALATLTHRIDELVGSEQAYSKWSRYWSLYGKSAQVFRPDECGGEFQRLLD